MVSPLGAFLGAQERGLGIQAQRRGLAQQDLQTQRSQLGLQQEQVNASLGRAQLLSNAIDAVGRLPVEQRFATVQQLRPELQRLGVDLPDFGPEQLTDQALAGHKASLTGFIQNPQEELARFQRGQGAIVETEGGGRAFATEIFDPASGTVRTEFAQIDRPLVSKTGETPQQVTQRKVEEARQTTTAREEAKQEVKRAEEAQKNVKTFEVFNLALNNLSQALGATELVGPLAGRIPATTSSAQIAEAAKAVMLPTLKQIFREAGEGTFTDDDRRALEALLPRREQTREAQLATIDAIELIVKAKLGMQPELFSETLGREVSEQDIEDTLLANPGVTREQLFDQLGIR